MKLKIDTYENYLNFTMLDISSTAEPENFDLYTDDELSKLDTFDKHFEYDLLNIGNISKIALENNENISKELLYKMKLKDLLNYFKDHPNA